MQVDNIVSSFLKGLSLMQKKASFLSISSVFPNLIRALIILDSQSTYRTGSHSSTNQHGGGQFSTSQQGGRGTSQYGGHRTGTSFNTQTSGGQFSSGGSHGQSLTTWQTLTAKEQEMIRQNLGAISHTSQAGYSQGSYEDTRSYWETLSESERQTIIRNLARNHDYDDLSTEEQENIRRILISAIQRGQSGVRGPGVTVVRNRTSNTVFDENHNVVSHSESSTEYSLGHEGEAGSSFNNR